MQQINSDVGAHARGTTAAWLSPDDIDGAGHGHHPRQARTTRQPSAVPSASDSGSMKYTITDRGNPSRSRDGCFTCRARKVKCNERRPVCDKCKIKSRECKWPPEDVNERRRNKRRRADDRSNTSPSKLKDSGHARIDDEDRDMGRIAPASYAHPRQRDAQIVLPLPMLIDIPALSSSSFISQPHEHVRPAGMSSAREDGTGWVVRVNEAGGSGHNSHGDMPVNRDHVVKGTSAKSPLIWSSASGPGLGKLHVPPGFLPSHPTKTVVVGEGRAEDDLTSLLMPDRARAELLMEPSFLKAFFPTVDERLVIRHYLSRTVHIILAFESPHHPWNPWISVHAPLAFNHPPGTLPAADALRTAMLAVGGVHLQYGGNAMDQAAAWRITKAAKAKVLSLIRATIEGPDGKAKVLNKEETELILAALLSCTIASSLAADDSWHHLLSTVLSLVDQLGGAENILRDAPRDRLSPYRFFMEQLATRDVFGCMTTELAPTILQDAFTPWFFEAESWSRSDMEWESVDRMFGISRGMVDMIARACTLIASVRAHGKPLMEKNPKLPVSSHETPTEDPSLAALHASAQGLLAELRVWDEAENFTPLHPRTQYGNHSYRHAIKIRILRKVYNVPSGDERVVRSSEAIIELAKELLALYGKITWLTWPILIAGFEIPPNHPSRQSALDMLGAFGPHACFDNRAGARMLSDYWTWHDMDNDHATSWEVAQILNQRPFLD